jgi:hypothetical protein
MDPAGEPSVIGLDPELLLPARDQVLLCDAIHV